MRCFKRTFSQIEVSSSPAQNIKPISDDILFNDDDIADSISFPRQINDRVLLVEGMGISGPGLPRRPITAGGFELEFRLAIVSLILLNSVTWDHCFQLLLPRLPHILMNIPINLATGFRLFEP